MTKQILLLASMLMSILGFGQKSKNFIKGNGIIKEEIREVGNYQSITLKGGYDVILTDEPQGKIRLVGEENINPIILTEVKGGNLEIFVEPKKGYSAKKKNVVYVPVQNVHSFNLKGSGDIENNGKINAPHLQINLSGSGNIKLNHITTEKADITLLGSGDIRLSGNAVQTSYLLKGSGDISAFQFISNETKVLLQGSGDVEIFASESFIGEMRGSGDIKVKGNPKKVSKTAKGTGNITIL